jgi:hypothetical protein
MRSKGFVAATILLILAILSTIPGYACHKEAKESQVVKIPIQQITEATQSVKRYHFRMEYSPAGVIYEGDIDVAQNRQHIQLAATPEEFPSAEIFWEGDSGYGRILEANRWVRLSGGPSPDYLQSALETLDEKQIISTTEEGEFWLVDIQPPSLPIRDDPEAFYLSVFGEPADPEAKAFHDRWIELARRLDVSLQMKVSRQDYLVSQVTLQTKTGDIPGRLTLSFSPIEADLPSLPEEAAATAPSDVEVTPAMLLLHVESLGGWDENSHGGWAQRSIDLIKDRDTLKKYEEVYSSKWSTEPYTEQLRKDPKKSPDEREPDYTKHHPTVLGAVYEDCDGVEITEGSTKVEKGMPAFYDIWFASDENYKNDINYYWDQNPQKRDPFHFGFLDQGLKKQLYFFLYPGPDTTKPGDQYFSARDWGYGGNRLATTAENPKGEAINRLTFTEAIKQYNLYTMDGKRNAYLMLGHAVHLLQDQGHPDHAQLFPHPGGGLDEKQAYRAYGYCEVVATEVYWITSEACPYLPLCWLWCAGCAGTAALIAYGICWGGASEDEVGYEALIERKWDIQKNAEKAIASVPIPVEKSYDDYFAKLGDFAVKAQAASSLKSESPLGCGPLPLFPFIPGLDPNIDSTDPKQTAPYFALTDELVPQIIASGAGLMEHFYNIVNPPPYVEKVKIVQWEPNAEPEGFGKFFDPKATLKPALRTNPGQCVRYNASWLLDDGKRTLKTEENEKITPDRAAYVFLQFGPATIDGKPRTMKEVGLKLVGTDWTGKPIDELIELKHGNDTSVGDYYWGSFKPRNCGKDPYKLTLEITGKDDSVHLAGRTPLGDVIDADPATLAQVDPSQSSYPWINYKPDIDKNHVVTIDTNPALSISADPTRVTISCEELRQGTMQKEIQFQVKTFTWDCSREYTYEVPSSCPYLQWRLGSQVTRMAEKGLKTEIGTWSDFGLQGDLTVGRNAYEATLSIRADFSSYKSGIYEVTAYCDVYPNGTIKPADMYTLSAVVQVELLPTLTISPASGAGGTSATVSGRGFKADGTVTITSGRSSLGTRSTAKDGSFSAEITIPSLGCGQHIVTVTDETRCSATVTFTVVNPDLTISPASGAGGTVATVSGSGFTANGRATIAIDGRSLTTWATGADSSFSAQITIPSLGCGQHTVTVTDETGCSATGTFNVIPSLNMSPASGAGGAIATVSGSGFTANNSATATIGGSTVGPWGTATDGSFSGQIAIPFLACGQHTLTVTDGAGCSATGTFTVKPNLAISPAFGAGGTIATVSGSGFTAGNTVTVTIGSSTLGTWVTAADGSFSGRVAIPSLEPGQYSVTATDGAGCSAVAAFTVQPS